MRSDRMTWIGLAAIWMLGMGASTEGIQQARDWQSQGDLALAGKQMPIAYTAYMKIATTFPDTAHGRRAAARARQIRAEMASPERSPASENLFSWIGEIIDFLTWP